MPTDSNRIGEEPFSALVDVLPQIVWTARPDGAVDYCNRRWFEFTGITPEEMQGWGWTRSVHPDDRQRCVERWTQAVQSGSSFECACQRTRNVK